MSKLTDSIDQARATSRKRLDTAKEKASDGVSSIKELTSERLDNAKDIANEGSLVVRERMSESKQRAAELLGNGKEKAAQSVTVTKETARKAITKSEETVAKNPLSVLAGGIALGAVLAALLPRTKTETKIVGSAGRAINTTAKKAFETAKEVGQEQAAELGLNSDTIRDQIKDWLGKAFETAKSAAKEDRQDKQ